MDKRDYCILWDVCGSVNNIEREGRWISRNVVGS
jgi:hypothetical protein